jgi:uncharacterized protein (DUF2147 family)
MALSARIAAAVFFIGAGAASAAAEPATIFGTWRNPKDSVHVDIRPCGPSACGYVIWATPKARDDARRGSGRELVGLQLLREFSLVGNAWRGKVFVPDMNVTLGGAARPLDADHLEARGCVIGKVLCKAQVWSRVRNP